MKNYLLCMLFVAITLTSCKPSKTLVDISCSGYLSPDFIRNDILKEGISIMPVLGGRSKEEFRRPMGLELTKYLRYEFSPEKVKSPSEVIEIMNTENLTEDYASAIGIYSTTGILPKEFVMKLGKALDVRYLFFVSLLDNNYTGSFSNQAVITRVNIDEIYVQGQVWDTRKGDIVWEGKGGAAKSQLNGSDLVVKTAEGLSKVIGTDKNIGPCETKDTLYAAAAKAHMNTTLAWSIPLILLPFLILLPLL